VGQRTTWSRCVPARAKDAHHPGTCAKLGTGDLALLADELRSGHREILRCALLTLSYRVADEEAR
jgi:hypothetical protein